jgi:hypothetical protein
MRRYSGPLMLAAMAVVGAVLALAVTTMLLREVDAGPTGYGITLSQCSACPLKFR